MSPRQSLVLAVPLAIALGLGAPGASAMVPTDTSLHRIPNPPSIALGQLPERSVVGDGAVLDVEQVGDVVYAYGAFDQLGRFTGPGRILDATTGADRPTPVLGSGEVSVTIADGDGGWYVGGSARGGVLHVLADGSVDAGFDTDVNGLVSAIASDGDTLYVGGLFSRVNGIERQNIAAISATDGSLLPFATDAAEHRVTELAADGDALWMAVGTTVTSLDASGVPLTTTSFSGQVHALEVGDGVVYVGEKGLRAIDPATGDPDGGFANAVTSGTVHTLLLDGDRLYAGTDGSTPLLAVSPETGVADATFDGDIPAQGAVYDLALDGDRLWAGGAFAGGKLAVLDAATGAALDVDVPDFHLQVNAVEVSGGSVYVGGHFYLDDRHRTRNLAALDAETMQPLPGFHANATRAYGELTVAPNAIYLAPAHYLGFESHSPYFWSYKTTVRAFDPVTGAADEARTQKQVEDLTGLTVLGNRLVIAQRLGNNEKFPANRITVFKPNGAKAWSFEVPLKGYITNLATVGGDLLVAGSFKRTARNGGPRNTALLRLDPRTGARRAYFDPYIHGPVNDLSVQGGSIYASGLFHRVFGGGVKLRPGLVKLDARGDMVETFDPAVRGGGYGDWYNSAVAIGPDLVWADARPEAFLDATTGKRVDVPGFPADAWLYDVDGDADTVVLGGRDIKALAGQGYVDLGFVIGLSY